MKGKKRKSLALLTVATMLAVSLAGCGKETTSTVTSTEVSVSTSLNEPTPDKNEAEVSVSVSVEPEKEPELIKADYSSVLNEIYEEIRDFDFFYADYKESFYGVCEYVFYHARERDSLKSIGYKITDLNEDGIDELLIVGNDGGFGIGTEILSVYGYSEGEPVLLLEGSSRSVLYLLSDNIILEIGSLGAMSSICGEYRVKDGSAELKVVDFHFSYVEESGREVVCQNETGDLDPENSFNIEKSIDEYYNDIFEKEESAVEIEFELLDGYKYSGDTDYTKKEAANVNVSIYKSSGPFIPGFVADGVSAKDKYSTKLLFTTDATISNFTVWNVLSMEADESGNISYVFEEMGHMGFETLEEPKTVDPDEEMIAVIKFNGDMPEYAFSYRDTNGEFRRFLVYQSGKDGSIQTEYVK